MTTATANAHDDAPATTDAAAWQHTFVVVTAAVIGGCLAYVLCDWGGWPRLQHNPYSGAWWWQSGPTQRIPINYYGDVLWGLGGAAIGAGVAIAGTAFVRKPHSPTFLSLMAAWALTSWAFAGLYYMWNLWPF